MRNGYVFKDWPFKAIVKHYIKAVRGKNVSKT